MADLEKELLAVLTVKKGCFFFNCQHFSTQLILTRKSRFIFLES